MSVDPADQTRFTAAVDELRLRAVPPESEAAFVRAFRRAFFEAAAYHDELIDDAPPTPKGGGLDNREQQ